MEYGFSSVSVDHDNSPTNSQGSPSSSMFNNTKANLSSLPKRSRRSIQKRVVSVPIKEIQGSRLKGGDTNAPPSDSWAWKKYGQKPIKGSPYPRAYYRCSSSKGCPARKQVERSRADPTMVMVTYSCDHNHRWPASRNNNHNSTVSPPPADEEPLSNHDDQEEDPPLVTESLIAEHKEKFTGLEVCPSYASFVTTTDQLGWFSELESPASTMLEIPLMVGNIVEDADMAMIFSIREEDESLFADLGELPECTTVFKRSSEIIHNDKHQRRRCNVAT